MQIPKIKLSYLLIAAIAVLVYLQFFYINREKAAGIIWFKTYGEDWDTGYLKARAKGIKSGESTFKFEGNTYDSKTGKKI